MGYYTDYSLSHDSRDGIDEALITELNDASGYSWRESLEYEGIKWYSHNNHMLEISKKFPTVVFTLEGKGEEPDDMWQKYYLNGRVQVVDAKITYEEFDILKLK